ncbi:2-C-methyl-D-erythritol 4-phosphate cytidylyltransferase [Halothiobacillus sp. DCM-1]|uniref:2-C-methyl-D-erythritol 4-phosphate cytidylyltransferase n=1 Tax=Halothiobacillus sp. DCM-1 TaxID=3112558 RepID=UPI0032503703
MTEQQNAYPVPPWWLVIPAAGAGRRMGSDLPKQFLPLAGHSVLATTLSRLVGLPALRGVVLVVSPDAVPHSDFAGAAEWSGLPVVAESGMPPRYWVAGGAERADSVLAGLKFLRDERHADPADWVLVHDAARPCVRPADVRSLLDALHSAPDGALLATPVRDTLKRAEWGDGARVSVTATVPREQLYHALTPQAFPLARLMAALTQALAAGVSVTDEASAIEWAGGAPQLVMGHTDNLKITRPEDLPLARMILQAQAEDGG